MQIHFQKEDLQVSDMITNQTMSLLAEGDVIVPDIKPDIKKILQSEATAVITNREFEGSKLIFSGFASVKILYIPEGKEEGPKSIDAKFEFKDAIDLGIKDDIEVNIKAQAEHVDYSLINSRKLHMKVLATVAVKGYRQRELSLLTGTEEGGPLMVRTKPLSVYQMVCDTSKELTVTETLEIPTAKPDAEEILGLSVKAMRGECKIMSGKMIVKGALVVRTLYQCSDHDEGIQTVEHEVPFGEMVEIPGLDDSCLCNVSYDVKDIYYMLKDDVNGDPRVISLDAVLRADIIASRICDTQYIDDCYSLSGHVEIARETLTADALLFEGTSHLNIKEILAVPAGEPVASAVYSIDCRPKVQELLVADEKLIIRGKLNTYVLYASAEGEEAMYSLVGEYDFEHVVPSEGVDETAILECGVTDQNISFSLNAASEIELRCVLEFYTRVIRRQVLSCVNGCEFTEEETENEARRGLVIYFAQHGDTLWDIAKYYRTDQHQIMKLNQMDSSQILAGQKILIPGTRL